jgi:hypothetical protein
MYVLRLQHKNAMPGATIGSILRRSETDSGPEVALGAITARRSIVLALERFDVFRCAILAASYAAQSVWSFNWRFMVSKPVSAPRDSACRKDRPLEFCERKHSRLFGQRFAATVQKLLACSS